MDFCHSDKLVLTNVGAERAVIAGGVYSKGGETSYVGWAIQLAETDLHLVEATVAMAKAWAEESESKPKIPSSVTVTLRPNDFITLAKIDAGLMRRSRMATCPARKYQMLDYARDSVPLDLDLNRVMRFAGKCQ